jgi:hypothetical protein
VLFWFACPVPMSPKKHLRVARTRDGGTTPRGLFGAVEADRSTHVSSRGSMAHAATLRPFSHTHANVSEAVAAVRYRGRERSSSPPMLGAPLSDLKQCLDLSYSGLSSRGTLLCRLGWVNCYLRAASIALRHCHNRGLPTDAHHGTITHIP